MLSPRRAVASRARAPVARMPVVLLPTPGQRSPPEATVVAPIVPAPRRSPLTVTGPVPVATPLVLLIVRALVARTRVPPVWVLAPVIVAVPEASLSTLPGPLITPLTRISDTPA